MFLFNYFFGSGDNNEVNLKSNVIKGTQVDYFDNYTQKDKELEDFQNRNCANGEKTNTKSLHIKKLHSCDVFPVLLPNQFGSEIHEVVCSGDEDIYNVKGRKNDDLLIKSLEFQYSRFQEGNNSTTSSEFFFDEIIVEEDIFNEIEYIEDNEVSYGYSLLITFVLAIIKKHSSHLKNIKIFNEPVRRVINEEILSNNCKIPKLESFIVDDVLDIARLTKFECLKSVSVNLVNDNLVEKYKIDSQNYNKSKSIYNDIYKVLNNLEEFSVMDDDDSSLRLFKFFQDHLMEFLDNDNARKLIFNRLKILKFNHYHGISNYNTIEREFSINVFEKVISFSEIEELSMILNCDIKDCSCLPQFLGNLCESDNLRNINKISFFEKLYKKNLHKYSDIGQFNTVQKHQIFEDWDTMIFQFLNGLVDSGKVKNLTDVLIQYDPPIDGIIDDGVEGNYLRRRKLWETVLPKLENLQSLILPNILSNIGYYEQITSNILWNGKCDDCNVCKKYLSIFDDYLMTHQIFDQNGDFRFKDILSTQLFAFLNDNLSKKIPFSDCNFKRNNKVLANKKLEEKNIDDDEVLKEERFNRLQDFEISTRNIYKYKTKNLISWDFHNDYLPILCRDFKNDKDDDFYNWENFDKYITENDSSTDLHSCGFDQSCFMALCQCADHFFRKDYVDWLASTSRLQNLKFVVLNGIYYQLEKDFENDRCIIKVNV